MNEIRLIFCHEWRALIKKEKMSLCFLFVTAVCWGLFLGSRLGMIASEYLSLWVVFFALVASAGFGNMVFVRERLSGAWEILLVSGLSRRNLFRGKLLFTTTMSLLFGGITFVIMAMASRFFLVFDSPLFTYNGAVLFFLLFPVATLLVNCITGWFVLIAVNPRVIHLVTFVILLLLSGISMFFDLSVVSMAALFLVPIIVCLFLAERAVYREKNVQPLIY